MTFALEFILDGLPPSNNARYTHWSVRAADQKKWRMASRMAAYYRRPNEPLSKAKLILTRCSSREVDYDNLVTTFKPVVDGLIDAKIIVDDNSSVIVAREYLWVKAKERKGHVIVRVEGVA